MGRFEALVAEGLALGLDRAGAEARAREMLFSDGGEPGPSSQPSPSSDDSIEELWPKLRRKWDSRGTGLGGGELRPAAPVAKVSTALYLSRQRWCRSWRCRTRRRPSWSRPR